MRPCVEKLIWPIFGCNVGQMDLVVTKRKLDTAGAPPTGYIYQASSSYIKTCGKKIPLAESSAEIPLPSVCDHQSTKNCPPMTKISRGQNTHYISVCTNSEKIRFFVKKKNELASRIIRMHQI